MSWSRAETPLQPDPTPPWYTLGTLYVVRRSRRLSAADRAGPVNRCDAPGASPRHPPSVGDAAASGPARRINLAWSDAMFEGRQSPTASLWVVDGPPALTRKGGVGMRARFLRMSFVRASRPSLMALSRARRERKQKLVHVGNASHTEGNSARGGRAGLRGRPRTLEERRLQRPGAEADGRVPRGALASSAGSGPISSWSQSFVLVWPCQRRAPQHLDGRASVVAPGVWIGIQGQAAGR